jgi:hypothetical protein
MEATAWISESSETYPARRRRVRRCRHDDDATIVADSKGDPEPDPALRDTETCP